MEAVTWFTHKFIMHKIMWYFHRDHHQPEPGFFEKNDAFFLIFAIPSWLCIMLGLMYNHNYITCIGAGIGLYGLAYFLVHDVFIHQRFKWLRNTNTTYFRALRKAHKVHHKHLEKEDGECFGMLYIPRKYFKEERASQNKKIQSN